MKLYLAGAMTGIVDMNFPAFDYHASLLREVGYYVFNPADHDREFMKNAGRGITPREALGADTAWICAEADGIATIGGWQNSPGARAEVALAEALKLPVRSTIAWLTRAGEAA